MFLLEELSHFAFSWAQPNIIKVEQHHAG